MTEESSGPTVAVYVCTRCGETHYERFDWLFDRHRRFVSPLGIGYVTEAVASVVVLQRRERGHTE